MMQKFPPESWEISCCNQGDCGSPYVPALLAHSRLSLALHFQSTFTTYFCSHLLQALTAFVLHGVLVQNDASLAIFLWTPFADSIQSKQRKQCMRQHTFRNIKLSHAISRRGGEASVSQSPSRRSRRLRLWCWMRRKIDPIRVFLDDTQSIHPQISD